MFIHSKVTRVWIWTSKRHQNAQIAEIGNADLIWTHTYIHTFFKNLLFWFRNLNNIEIHHNLWFKNFPFTKHSLLESKTRTPGEQDRLSHFTSIYKKPVVWIIKTQIKIFQLYPFDKQIMKTTNKVENRKYCRKILSLINLIIQKLEITKNANDRTQNMYF